MKFLSPVLNLLYPEKCILCHRPFGKLSPEEEERKKVLGICPHCSFGSYRIEWKEESEDHLRAAFRYEGQIRQAVGELKYHGRKSHAAFFARWMLEDEDLRDFVSTFDILTAVPVSRQRFRTRGYNQAELLARRIGESLKIPYQEMVERSRDTAALKGLNKNERIANLAGAFSLAEEAKKIPAGEAKRVLVIDDICTTGSTLSMCRQVILDAFPGWEAETLAFSSENEDYA